MAFDARSVVQARRHAAAQHRHLSLANDPLFFTLLPYRACLQPASAEQRMAFAASKAWIELGACGPDNPAVKASGADLLLSVDGPWMMAMSTSEIL
jgi:hypothetical protein